ncbi:MFS transporter [Candidatus Enterococcus ferrettii]|uniref:Cell division protein n=1 Tax=Candidatus Enterococcus ferrettii TaxID=2815324 RepID=A0ABV0EVS2_9ENTE|nr:MFS transporter [Enterococcus sp. 665A]MBO1342454.1 MFS transporter [Enterococcus sp. 665A]
MKKYISRDEVTKLLVTDSYYEKGHLGLKIVQFIVAIIGWILVILPFIWVLSPLLFGNLARRFNLFTYVEELQTLKFLLIFLTIAFFVILVLSVILTIWNNYRFNHLLQRKEMYDVERVKKRNQLLSDDFEKRFGPKKERESTCYYLVKEEQNLDAHYVRDLYKKGDVDL